MEKLLDDFLEVISDMSVREAAGVAKLTHGTIQDLRRARRANKIPRIHPATARKIREYIEGVRMKSSGLTPDAANDSLRRAVTMLAADKLEKLAAEMRAEAMGSSAPPPREVVNQVKRVAAAAKATQQAPAKKQAGRKGG